MFVRRYTGHQTIRTGQTHVRRRGRVPGRYGRLFSRLHQHGRIGFLRVSGRSAAGRGLENLHGRGRVFRSGTATGKMQRTVCKHLRIVQMLVIFERKCSRAHHCVSSPSQQYTINHTSHHVLLSLIVQLVSVEQIFQLTIHNCTRIFFVNFCNVN